MAFSEGIATSMQDLFDDLGAFLDPGAGWTDRALSTAGSEGYTKVGTDDTVNVQFRWDTSTPDFVGVYQSDNAGAASVVPGQETTDSGQGEISGTSSVLDDGRNVRLLDSNMPYWFFEDDDYCHIVVEINAGPPRQYAHFGMGVLLKRGDWTGGAYGYGWRRSPTSTNPNSTDVTWLLDGQMTGAGLLPFAATMHVEGLNDQPASGLWSIIWGGGTTVGNDRQTTPIGRVFVQGGYRSGLAPRFFGRPSSQLLSGNIPMYPIEVFYRNNVPAIDEVMYLGQMPDVQGVNIANFVGGQEVTVGSDTWVVFPSWTQSGTQSNETREQGVAYKKVTT